MANKFGFTLVTVIASEAKQSRKCAFTLAEVLITLAIIGVVAALTIPSVVSKNREQQSIVGVKKAYSVLSQAFNLAKNEYGDPTNWDLIAMDSAQCNINFRSKFLPYLNTMKICEGSNSGCMSKTYKDLNGVTT